MRAILKTWRAKPRSRSGVPKSIVTAILVVSPLLAAGTILAGTTPAAAQTGGYPYWNMPCELSPYNDDRLLQYRLGTLRLGSGQERFSAEPDLPATPIVQKLHRLCRMDGG